MRNSLDIIPNHTLKGLSCKFPTISSLQPNSIIKLSQNQNYIYLRYNPLSQPSPSSINSNKVQLPSKLCQFNNLTKGCVQFQPIFNIKQCHKLSIYVNRLDWQIINNKVQMLQQQFMNQVQIIWPGAYIPIFYDKINLVKIRVQCQAVCLLVQNSELEVLVDENLQKQDKQQKKQMKYSTDILKILPISLTPVGNINKIYITKSHLFYKNEKQKQNKSKQLQKIKDKQKYEQKQKQKQQKIKYNISTNLQNTQLKITNKILNQPYLIKLHYRPITTLHKQFPCDTNQVSIKNQINLIKMQKQTKNNHNMNKNKDKDKYQSLLVQVNILQDYAQIQDIYHNDTGKKLQKIVYNIQKLKLQDQQQQHHKKMKQQELPKYCAFTPPDYLQTINIIYLSQALVKNWGIDTKKQLHLQILPKPTQTPSKKLQYLLNLSSLSINIIISQKNQKMPNTQKIRQNIVNNFIQNWNKQDNSNSLTIYSKIPYLYKINNDNKFIYVYFMQNEKEINDPLTIYYNPNNHNKNNKNNIKQLKQKQANLQKLQPNKQDKHNNNIKQKLINVINIQNYFYADQNTDDIKIKNNVLWKLNCISQKQKIQLLNQTKYRQNRNYGKGILKYGKSNQQIFLQLYKICYQRQIDDIMKFLKANKIFLPILLTSFANNGKTIMNTILRQHGFNTLYIDLSQMDDTSHNLADLSQYLQLVFQMYTGQYIFMDNLDSVCYKIDQGDLHRRQERIAAKLLLRQITKYSKIYNKLCIFTAKNQTNIDQQLVHYQLIKLKNPIRQIREKILTQFNLSCNKKQAHSSQKIVQIVENSQSMSFGEFSKYVIVGHREQKNLEVGTSMDFKKLAGIKQVKNVLRTVVQRPLKYSFVFKKLPIKLSRGVLLYGGSGTGKSAVGEALAGQFKMKFFTVKGSDILSKYIGGSQAAVRDVFEKAMSVSPSIVFFDEFQSIVPRRNSSNTGVTDRVVNQFLCYLDGVASVQGVYIIAASSRPELIDPALLRPGRIDTHIFLDYPTSQQRKQLFSLYNNSISFQTSIEQLLDITQNFSYSDLIGLIKQLRIKQSAKIIKQNSNLHEIKIEPKQFKHINTQFLKQTIKNYKISMSKQQKMRQRQKFLKFKRGDAPDLSKQKTILQ